MSCFENTSYQINEIYLTRCKQLWCVSVMNNCVIGQWFTQNGYSPKSNLHGNWSMDHTMQWFWWDQKSLSHLRGEWVTQWFWSKQVNGRWDNSVNGQWRSWNNSPANDNSRAPIVIVGEIIIVGPIIIVGWLVEWDTQSTPIIDTLQ